MVFIFHGTRAARSFRTPIFFTLATIKRQNRDSRVTPVPPINFHAATRPKREIAPQRFVSLFENKKGTKTLLLRLILLSFPLVRRRNGQLYPKSVNESKGFEGPVDSIRGKILRGKIEKRK